VAAITPILDPIELDIEEEEHHHADDSDFEE
jgi:hypothetical protein